MIYSYNTETGEYSATMPYETETGDGKTAVAPPEIPEGKAAVYNAESQTWSLVNDYRFSHKKVDSELNIYDIENLGDIEDGFYLVTNETAENIELTPYKYKIQDGNVVAKTDEEYLQEQTEKERQRLNLLNLTKADVLLALYEDKGITPEDIKTMLKDNVPALIKFDYASSYYRGDEVVNALGPALGYTTEEMDYLFENKKFPEKPVEPADTDSDSDTDVDSDTDTDVEPEA